MIWIIILSIVALIVVLGLSGYTIRLLKQLKQQNIMIAKSKAIREARLKESIEIIARAMQSGECNHSEGVIRLTMLLMPFGKTLTPYPSMAQLHEISGVALPPAVDGLETAPVRHKTTVAAAEMQTAVEAYLGL